MPGPWEKYAAQAPAEEGPWSKFAQATPAPTEADHLAGMDFERDYKASDVVPGVTAGLLHAANSAMLGKLPETAGFLKSRSAIYRKVSGDERPIEDVANETAATWRAGLEQSSREYPVPSGVGDFLGLAKGLSGKLWDVSTKAAGKVASSLGGKLIVGGTLGGGASAGLSELASEDATPGSVATQTGLGAAGGAAVGTLGAGAVYGAKGIASVIPNAVRKAALTFQKFTGNPELKAALSEPAKLVELNKQGGAAEVAKTARQGLTDAVENIQNVWRATYTDAAKNIDNALGEYGSQLDKQLSSVTQEVMQAAQSQQKTATQEMQVAGARLVEVVRNAKAAPNLFWESKITPELEKVANKPIEMGTVMGDLADGFSSMGWVELAPHKGKFAWKVPQGLDPRFSKNANEIAALLNKTKETMPFSEMHKLVREVANFANFRGDVNAAQYPMNKAWESMRGIIAKEAPEASKLISQYGAARQMIDPVAQSLLTRQGDNVQMSMNWLKAIAENSLLTKASKLGKFAEYSPETASAVKDGLQAATRFIETKNVKPGNFAGLRSQMVKALEKGDPNAQEGWAKVTKTYDTYQQAAFADHILTQRQDIPPLIKKAMLDDAAHADLQKFISEKMPNLKPMFAKLNLSRKQLKLHASQMGETRKEIAQMVKEGIAENDATAIGFVLDTVPGARKMWDSGVFADMVRKVNTERLPGGLVGQGVAASTGYSIGAATSGGFKAGGLTGAALGVAFMHTLNNPIKVAEMLYKSKAVNSMAEASKRANLIKAIWPKIQMLTAKGIRDGQQQ